MENKNKIILNDKDVAILETIKDVLPEYLDHSIEDVEYGIDEINELDDTYIADKDYYKEYLIYDNHNEIFEKGLNNLIYDIEQNNTADNEYGIYDINNHLKEFTNLIRKKVIDKLDDLTDFGYTILKYDFDPKNEYDKEKIYYEDCCQGYVEDAMSKLIKDFIKENYKENENKKTNEPINSKKSENISR